jgi:predicted PurR-regulated permease PerM
MLMLVAIILMGVLSGIPGVIFAAPIMAVVIVLVRTLYIDVLIDGGPAD